MPSWLTVTIQVGNLVSILYSFLLQPRVPSRFTFVPIIFVLTLAPLVSIAIALLWKTTTVIGGKQHSVALSTFGALSGLVGALCTVTIFPWASLYGATMVAAVSSGSGANGLITALLAVAQHPTSARPHFSLHTYFFVLSGVLFVSLICFILVQIIKGFDHWKEVDINASIENDRHTIFASPQYEEDDYLTPSLTDSFRKNYSSTQFKSVNSSFRDSDLASGTSESDGGIGADHVALPDEEHPHILESDDENLGSDSLIGNTGMRGRRRRGEGGTRSTTEIPTKSLLWHIRAPIMYQFYINLLYYLILGLLPFAFKSTTKVHEQRFIFWTNVIGMVLNAAGRVLTFKWRFYFPRTFSLIQTPFFAFIFILCFLQQYHVPEALSYIVTLSFGVFSLIFGYADTINFQLPIKLLEGFSGEIQRASRWVAVANQVGSLVGAMIGFSLTIAVLQKTT